MFCFVFWICLWILDCVLVIAILKLICLVVVGFDGVVCVACRTCRPFGLVLVSGLVLCDWFLLMPCIAFV